jgi:hypothetical protein
MYLAKKLVVAACMITLALTSAKAAEDLTIVAREGSETWTLYISSGMVRQSYRDSDAIFDLANRTYTQIYHLRGQYFVSTEKEMRDWGERAQQKLSEIHQSAERIASEIGTKIPPMEQPSISFEKGTAIKQIAGYDCEQYLIKGRSGQVIQEWWVAPALASPPYFEMLKIASAIDPASTARVFDEMKDNGVRLGLIVRVPAGALDKSWEAYEVKKGPIDPSLFRVSVDSYDKIESPFVKFKLGIGRK